jgi:pilus assembly protein FimV
MTLLNLIIASYSNVLLAIGLVAAFVFVLGIYFIFRMAQTPEPDKFTLNIPAAHKSIQIEKTVLPDTASDVTAIAGDDPMATQLDLARAYIETGKKQFAKIILAAVIREGNAIHQEEAQRLLSTL